MTDRGFFICEVFDSYKKSSEPDCSMNYTIKDTFATLTLITVVVVVVVVVVVNMHSPPSGL